MRGGGSEIGRFPSPGERLRQGVRGRCFRCLVPETHQVPRASSNACSHEGETWSGWRRAGHLSVNERRFSGHRAPSDRPVPAARPSEWACGPWGGGRRDGRPALVAAHTLAFHTRPAPVPGLCPPVTAVMPEGPTSCAHTQEAPGSEKRVFPDSVPSESLLSLPSGYYVESLLTPVFPEKPKKRTWEMSPNPCMHHIEGGNKMANGGPMCGALACPTGPGTEPQPLQPEPLPLAVHTPPCGGRGSGSVSSRQKQGGHDCLAPPPEAVGGVTADGTLCHARAGWSRSEDAFPLPCSTLKWP